MHMEASAFVKNRRKLLHRDHGMNNGRPIRIPFLWRHKFPLGCDSHVSKFPIQSLYYPWLYHCSFSYLARAFDAWRVMWICVRIKDAQKQFSRMSLNVQPLSSGQLAWATVNSWQCCIRKKKWENKKAFFYWHAFLISEGEILSLYSFNQFSNAASIFKFTDSTTRHWKNGENFLWININKHCLLSKHFDVWSPGQTVIKHDQTSRWPNGKMNPSYRSLRNNIEIPTASLCNIDLSKDVLNVERQI